VLDLGTGSGAIALAVAHGLQAAERAEQAASILALDASSNALALAADNALGLGLAVQFLQSNWFSEVSGCFHLIASNPPYIATADAHLAALSHEPIEALTSGSDGLDDIRQIIENAPTHLESGGWLLLEHGYDQAARVRDLLVTRGFGQVQSRLDLAGIERCTGGQWLG
jgi:release factor glutamine methyltransferase